MQKALTVSGSLITRTSQAHLAESGRKRTACAISRSVISRTLLARSLSASIFFFLSSWPIIELYAAADWPMAMLSGTNTNWLRPVMGLAEQPASRSETANSSKDLRDVRMRPRFYGDE